jgi:hypothetical protein
MSRRQIVLVASAVIGIAVAAAGWRAWVLLRPVPLPPVGTARPEPPGPCVFDPLYRSPPQNVADLLKDADAVLWVGLQTIRTDRWGPPGPDEYTIYHFSVWESVKGAARRGDTVKIARWGGPECWESEFPRPGLGEQFLVFLQWFPEAKAYRHMYGPMTTFLVLKGRLQPMGVTYEQLAGREVGDFLRELREGTAPRGK